MFFFGEWKRTSNSESLQVLPKRKRNWVSGKRFWNTRFSNVINKTGLGMNWFEDCEQPGNTQSLIFIWNLSASFVHMSNYWLTWERLQLWNNCYLNANGVDNSSGSSMLSSIASKHGAAFNLLALQVHKWWAIFSAVWGQGPLPWTI